MWIGRPEGPARPGAAAADTAAAARARIFGLRPAGPRVLPHGPAALASLAWVPALEPLRIIAPPAAATLAGGHKIMLRAVGGERPLRILLDGAPIAATPALRGTAWMPPGAGFLHVSVLDAAGHSANLSLPIVVLETRNEQ